MSPTTAIASNRAYYTDSIDAFLDRQSDQILGALTRGGAFAVEATQRDAWIAQIAILQVALQKFRWRGTLYFEYSVPRLGKRIDVLCIIGPVIFVFEFKVGESLFSSSAIDQVLDYAVDLKNFHETSHDKAIAPVLITTNARESVASVATTPHNDGVLLPVLTSASQLPETIDQVISFCPGEDIDLQSWEQGRYHPTPTIVEAAMALYGGHSVADISRTDASAVNLTKTTAAISTVIRQSRELSRKSICFVTGVPGAGKTLVGLDVATKHINKEDDLYSVFLSGNGPLVAILREALARDKVEREKLAGRKLKKGEAMSEVKLFIQNVHNFRDECLVDINRPPLEHVALFDEAQRAWDLEQTASFMLRKKQRANFSQSEPEFLISCLDRHEDWAVIVCLVGGRQGIDTGEAGISEWIQSLMRKFPDWHVCISSRLQDAEYGAGSVIKALDRRPNVQFNDDLHLSVSMRSFRAESVSALVKNVLDRDVEQSKSLLRQISSRYPITLTRSVARAKQWLKEQARGSERYGIIVSSPASGVEAHAIDVARQWIQFTGFSTAKTMCGLRFFLKMLQRSSHVQGLELDWACVVWDADFRYDKAGWQHMSFVGSRWQNINMPERKAFLKNAYRVLLTRARRGMVIVVPEGESTDHTRQPAFYDKTFSYLQEIGFPTI